MSEVHDCGRMAGCPECPRGDDRRERYAAAIHRAGPYDGPNSEIRAEAAMAVADAEMTELREELADAMAALNCKCSDDVVCADLYNDAHSQWTTEINENARLRSELASTKAAHRAVWAKHQERGARVFELQGENARLREELADMTTECEAWKDTFYEQG